MGNRDTFDAVCRNLAADSGLAVVNVDYRLAPEHPFPAAVDDAWAATQWVAHRRRAWAADAAPDGDGRICRRKLAAVVCLLARDHRRPTILAQALVYPATDARLQAKSLASYAEGFMQRGADVEHAFRTYALDHGASPTDWRLSPLLAPRSHCLPPALVLTAECDAVRDDGEAYAAKLAQAVCRSPACAIWAGAYLLQHARHVAPSGCAPAPGRRCIAAQLPPRRDACQRLDSRAAIQARDSEGTDMQFVTSAARRSKRSRFITFVHAATKSRTKLACAIVARIDPGQRAQLRVRAEDEVHDGAVHVAALVPRSRPSSTALSFAQRCHFVRMSRRFTKKSCSAFRAAG